jgi:hypothetical protein
MRSGHARDNRRHIEIHLLFPEPWRVVPVVLSPGINGLITAGRCNDSECSDKSPGKGPTTR